MKKLKYIFFLLTVTSLVHCGGTSSQTQGGALEIVEVDGIEYELSAPLITATKQSNDVVIDLEIVSEEYFSHFEVQRKKNSGEFESLVDTQDVAFMDENLEGGSYTYQARSVYLIEDEFYMSDYVISNTVHFPIVLQGSK